jgi:hypothetical protein
MKYFISGHGDITDIEFEEIYLPMINCALEDIEHEFIIGDFKGVDQKSIEYLNGKTSNVIVYHIGETPKVNFFEFKTKGGFTSDDERDSAMSNDSDLDILWIREGKERSATAKNLKRREEITSKKLKR